MNQEIQANIYWHSLLEKWIGEVTEVGENQTCLYYIERANWDEVALGISRFLSGLTTTGLATYV
jgi:hypothetical protein